MKFEEINRLVDGVPFISTANARFLYDLIIRERLTSILELGIAHGTATCYMAAALEEIGGGSITAVDLLEALAEFKPSAEEQVARARLDRFANIVRMQTGYTWFLHDEIKKLTEKDVCGQKYDLCIIDGPKNWTIDGCAFFLVDKILKEGGWLIFDDYLWTYAGANSRRESTDGITHRKLSVVERNTPQVREIFELLVKQHPNYSELLIGADRDWVMAKKVAADRKTYTIAHRETFANFFSWAVVRGKRTLKKVFRA